MDGDVESNLGCSRFAAAFAAQPTGMLQPTKLDAPDGLFVAKMKRRKGVSMQLV
jgi:hypothetical protein